VITVSDDTERHFERRRDDVRLLQLEAAVRTLTAEQSKLEGSITASVTEIGRIRTTLGDRLTTLMYDLDQRYMPRGELEIVYVPRKEHTANTKERNIWRRQWPAIIIASLVFVVQVVTLVHALG
jgi:hypothetical protein